MPVESEIGKEFKKPSAPADRVFHSRAVRSLSYGLQDDPDVMVHQQLARLRFFEGTAGVADCRVLDFGCGSGFNCHELGHAKEVLGFDVSKDAVLLAQQSFPESRFVVADACASSLSLGEWDRILSCEVLEHVPDMPAFLDNVKRHLSSDGIAFISTPNRDIFSCGHEPSPINREHIKELNFEEFNQLLTARFGHVEIYGQSFSDPKLLEAWQSDVQQKIRKLEAGTRWPKPSESSAQSRVKNNPLVRAAYNIGPLQRLWKWIRWSVIEGNAAKRRAKTRPYSFTDFEFRRDDLSQAIWFCAIVTH